MRYNPHNDDGANTVYDLLIDNKINLYNAGDIETHFNFKMYFVGDKIPGAKIYIDGAPSRQLAWKNITAKGGDTYVKINTKLNIIEGYNAEGIKTGNVYNQFIKAGTFFKIPLGDSTLFLQNDNNIIENLDQNPIEYDYYYF